MIKPWRYLCVRMWSAALLAGIGVFLVWHVLGKVEGRLLVVPLVLALGAFAVSYGIIISNAPKEFFRAFVPNWKVLSADENFMKSEWRKDFPESKK